VWIVRGNDDAPEIEEVGTTVGPTAGKTPRPLGRREGMEAAEAIGDKEVGGAGVAHCPIWGPLKKGTKVQIWTRIY
jgi:hypothetical protein